MGIGGNFKVGDTDAHFSNSSIGTIILGDGRVPPAPPQPFSEQAKKVRAHYLKEARRDFEGRLQASIHHARFLDLGIGDDPAAVKQPWGYRNPDTKASYETVIQAFSASDGRLLILGQPGSGKTTTLLYLAHWLLGRADASLDAPVPFIFNLSKFQLRADTSSSNQLARKHRHAGAVNGEARAADTRVEEWLIAEMTGFPGLTRELAYEWLRDGRVAVLLDGLDEFNDERRPELVRLLNSAFLHQYPDLFVVVCSRVNEYAALRSREETRLQLEGAVELQPLNTEQIAAYLKSAHVSEFFSTIAADTLLRELAQTPLTLSMLVLAYSGLSPSELPSAGTLAKRRQDLIESYVARMLQRQARREQHVPFDDSRVNDVSIKKYRYRPQHVDIWLGWLALVLSVRMRTSFSLTRFHRVLRLNTNPRWHKLTFAATFLALSPALLLPYSVVALTMVPVTIEAAAWTVIAAIIGCALLPVLAAGGDFEGNPHIVPGSIMYSVMTGAALIDVGLLASVLNDFISLGVQQTSLATIAVIAAILLIADELSSYRLKVIAVLTLCGCATAVFVSRTLPDSWKIELISIDVLSVAPISIVLSIGAAFLERRQLLPDRLGILVVVLVFAIVAAAVSSAVNHISWIFGLIGLLATMSVMSCVNVAAGLTLALGLALFALGGGLLGGFGGVVVGSYVFGGVVFGLGILDSRLEDRISKRREHNVEQALSARRATREAALAEWQRRLERGDLAQDIDHLLSHNLDDFDWDSIERATRESDSWAQLKVRATGWRDTLLDVVDHAVLTPVAWCILAILGRFPWHRGQFVQFCSDAFLLKWSGHEVEFVHRLVRDYFALRQLLPTLEGPDRSGRLDAIVSLGYQGESAVDVLAELSKDEDPTVRAAALRGISHIASPIATQTIADHVSDAVPEVRQALISAVFNLSPDDRLRIVKSLKPSNDGTEVVPWIMGRVGFQYLSNSVELTRNVLRPLRRAGAQAVADCLRHRDKRVRVATARIIGELGEESLVPMLIEQANDPAENVRRAVVEALSNFNGDAVLETLTTRLRDRSIEVRDAAQMAIVKVKSPNRV